MRPTARRKQAKGGARAEGLRARLVAAAALCVVLLGCSGAEEPPPSDGFTVLSQPAAKAKPALPDPGLWETPVDDPLLEAGRVTWTGTCIDCHSTGLGGAPLIGNEALWSPRVAQGLDVLVEHATQGFYGKVGEMPARGGNADLSDDEVRAAVQFMVSKVGVTQGG